MVTTIIIFLTSLKPSDANMTSAIMVRSGAIIATGRIRAFKLSGNSVRPAYPGFIVINIPQLGLHGICVPINEKLGNLADNALRIDNICMATTDMTSILILLNSSKQPQDPDCTRPLNIRPTDL